MTIEIEVSMHSWLAPRRRARKEINLKYLTAADRVKYDEAMAKEWKNWLIFEAVIVVDPDKIPKEAQVVTTRWVHTDKNAIARSSGRKVPLLAKSRLVVQGHKELGTFRSDSPTASLLAFNLVCSTAASKKWKLYAGDAPNAYLQGDPFQRLLVLRPPHPLPDENLAGKLLIAKSGIYGTRDAGRGFWLKLQRRIHAAGWISHPLEPALFGLHDGDTLVGIMITHVDDLLYAGAGPVYEKAMNAIKKEFKLKENTGTFTFCGKQIIQDDTFTIYVGQEDAANSLEFIDITPARRKQFIATCTAEEVSEIRRVVGAVGWIARQTRPDLLAATSLLAQSLSGPKVLDIVGANSLVKNAIENAKFQLVFKSCAEIDYSSCRILGSSDAAFANAVKDGDKLKSQAGYVLGVRAKDGDALHFLEFSTGTVKRTCRSTLAAEANGLVSAVEAADYLRSVILALNNPNMVLSDLMDRGDVLPVQVYTDARSVYDVVLKDTSRPQDKRLRVVIAQLREMFGVPGTTLHWIDNSMMLADALTKLSAERGYLLKAITSNEWSDQVTEEALDIKKRIRDGRHARAELARECKRQRKDD